jgi:hypothetical protein
MAGRHRNDQTTATASEHVLAQDVLIHEIGEYMVDLEGVASPELIYKLRTFQRDVEYCRPEELTVYQQHFQALRSA